MVEGKLKGVAVRRIIKYFTWLINRRVGVTCSTCVTCAVSRSRRSSSFISLLSIMRLRLQVRRAGLLSLIPSFLMMKFVSILLKLISIS